ncbi:MAG: hypothetical protein AB7O47_02325 [Flavobacteriales bacterium]
MKGKKLNDLISKLNKSHRHTILNKCKVSSDKRYKELYDLLINYNRNNIVKLDSLLSQIGERLAESNNDNIDKAVRRFVDFAVILIEDVFLQEYISKNYPVRNSFLANIFKEKNEHELQNAYLRKLHNYKIENLDYNIQEQYYNDSITNSSRSGKNNEMDNWWKLIDEKYTLSNRYFLEKITNIYELASTSYLVDKKYGTSLLSKMMNHNHLNLILNVVDDSKQALEIQMAEVRFNFENYDKVYKLLNEVNNNLKKIPCTNEKDHDDLLRKVYFLNFLVDFNYKSSIEEIIISNQKLLLLSEKYNRTDSLNKFYNLLLRLFSDEGLDIDVEIDLIRKDFILHKDEYLLDFIRLYHSFVNKQYKKSLLLVNELSYAPNQYVRMWSKQIEILIHYKKGNLDVSETLLNRAFRQMKLMQTNPYTLSSSAMFMIQLHELLDQKVPKLYIDLTENFTSYSIIHSSLLKYF